MSRTRYVVVGAGLAGAATAWQLARRGADVTVLESFAPGHAFGSSHGSARIIRRAYADPFYAALTGEAWTDWADLEAETGEQVVTRTGGIDFGHEGEVLAVARAQAAEGIPHTLYDRAEATERWPQFAFSGPVLHHPEAGVLDADRAVLAMTTRATSLGATLHTGWTVVDVSARGSGYLLSSASGHAPVEADVVVVTAGPWLPELLPALPLDPALLPPLQVTQQTVFHFRACDNSEWPVFLHRDASFHYGLPGGADVGPGVIKVGEHDLGEPTTASGRSGTVDPATRGRLLDYVTRHVPGLLPEPRDEATCLYTNTPTEDFVVDRRAGLVVVSPCSGHGAKFAATIGRVAAELATGARPTTPAPFAFATGS